MNWNMMKNKRRLRLSMMMKGEKTFVKVNQSLVMIIPKECGGSDVQRPQIEMMMVVVTKAESTMTMVAKAVRRGTGRRRRRNHE